MARKLLLPAAGLAIVAYLFLTLHRPDWRKGIAFEGPSPAVGAVTLSLDGKMVAAETADKPEAATVKIWDVATGRVRANLQGHTHRIHTLAFSPDGKTLASGSLDRTVKLWDVAVGLEEATLRHAAEIRAIAFSPSGKILAAADRETLKLWDVPTGRERATLCARLGEFSAVAFSPGGMTLASGSMDGTVRLWDVASGKERACLQDRTHVRAVAFSPDGKALASGNSTQVTLWDVSSGEAFRRLTSSGFDTYVSSLAFSADGKTIASIENADLVKVWDVASGRNTAGYAVSERANPQSDAGQIALRSVAFGSGKILALGSECQWHAPRNKVPGQYLHTVKLWDVASAASAWR